MIMLYYNNDVPPYKKGFSAKWETTDQGTALVTHLTL